MSCGWGESQLETGRLTPPSSGAGNVPHVAPRRLLYIMLCTIAGRLGRPSWGSCHIAKANGAEKEASGAIGSQQPDSSGCVHQRTNGAYIPELVTITHNINTRRGLDNISHGA